MNQRILHRGPDSSGVFKQKTYNCTVFLGVNRLRIQNISPIYDQPFQSSNGCLAFNGEITNYKTLNDPNTEVSDTASLSQYLDRTGCSHIDALKGMFAFFYYHKSDCSIIIARDQHGIKPLYFFENDHYFIASSEIKGILASGLVEKKIESSQIHHYLTFKYCKAPDTFFQKIKEVTPGSVIKFCLKTGNKSMASFTTPIAKHHYSKQDLILNTTSLLSSSIDNNLLSTGPTGLLLSGGVDSTLILATISNKGIKNYPCYIVRSSHKDTPSPDFEYALQAANQFHGDARVLDVSSKSLERLPEIISALDQPIADSASLLTHLVSEYANRDVKVLLSGAGADEYFAGYNRHRAYYYYLKYIYSNVWAGKILNNIPDLPYTASTFLNEKFKLFNKLKSSIKSSPNETFASFQSMNIFKWKEDNEIEWNIENAFSNAIKHDRQNYLCADVLAITDVMSMTQSVEVRVPFLDQSLTNFIETVEEVELIKHGRKWILKEILKKHNVSNKFLNRPKHGFGIPFGDWIREKEYDHFLQPLADINNMLYEHIDFENVQEIIKIHLSRRSNMASEIWALITLQIWLKQNF